MRRVVISDASPLHYLILIGHEEVLPSLYTEVLIPEAVATVVIQVATSAGALALGLLLFVGAIGRADRRSPGICWLLAAVAPSGGRHRGLTPPFSPRPPPHAWSLLSGF